MTPADLSRTLVRAVRCAVEDGELPAQAGVPGGRVVVERTRPGGVGEYATPVAFQLAKGAGRRPADVARLLARRLDRVDGIERVEITGAGFLNFVLAPPSAAEVVRAAQAHAPRPEYEAQHAPEAEAPAVTGLRQRAVPEVPAPAVTGLRERAVHEAVLRIRRSQGLAPAPTAAPAPVAPVARRDGDVVARYGDAAARWAMLTVAPQETPVFSPALLLQSEPGEFFRVRYAFSRSRALLRNAAQLGFTPLPGPPEDTGAGPLLRALTEYPLVLEAAAHHRAPERLARHLVELADALLDFQYRVLPHGDEKPSAAHRARLALAEAAGTVLAGGLALLGIDAPERL
ncbi:ArgS-related anticodon-binding protein NrtL [Streptomyces xanthophaeus]|uniref:ArgS-related anticodon-binding protein NrtL n=1 Tax=Streptomyces xanthophaeus TaxID=67385 RepID=UPI0039900D45